MKTPKEIAVEFLKMILSGDIRKAYRDHTGPSFKHHNAYFKADADSLMKGMEDNHEHFPDKIFDIHQVIAEGNRVAVHSFLKFTPEHEGVAVVHLFRFEGDKIAEFWDVAMLWPETCPNENGPL